MKHIFSTLMYNLNIECIKCNRVLVTVHQISLDILETDVLHSVSHAWSIIRMNYFNSD